MLKKESNVVLNFKMNGQVQYAKTIRDINAIMNAAASEYKTQVAAMGKDADASKKLAAEKKKLEIQMEAAKERTKMLRAEYESMAKDTKTSTAQLANKHKELMNSERAEIALSNALERVNEGLSEQAEQTRKAEEALNKLEKESEQLESQTNKLNAEYDLQKAQLGENASETEKLQLKMEQLNDTHELAKEKVENYEKQLEQAKKAYGENSTEVDKYEVQLLEARTAEQQLANEIATTNKQLKEQSDVLKKTSDNLKVAGDKMKDIGKDLSIKVTTPLVGVAAAATKIGMDFESSMSEVAAISGATGEDFEQLEAKAREMGATTNKSAKDAADGFGYMALAGWETNQMLEGIEPILKLSSAGNIDLARTSDLVTDSMAAMQLEVEDLPDFLDMVAQASRKSNTDIDALMEAFLVAGGTMASFNVPLEESTSLLGVLANRGYKGAEAGTAMNAIFTNLTSGMGASGKAMEELGLSAFDADGNFKGLEVVLLEVKEKLSGLKEEEQAHYISMIAGKEHLKTFNALLAGLGDEYVELKDDVSDANGVLEEMYGVMTDNLKGRWDEFKSAMEEAGIAIFDNLQPALESALGYLQKAVDAFNNLSPRVQNAIVIIGGLAIALGPLLMIFGSMATGLSAIISVGTKFFGLITKLLPLIKVLGGAIAGISAPVWGVIAAITALIAIGVALYKNWDTIKDKAVELKDIVVEKFTEMKDGVVTKVSELKDDMVIFFTESIPEAFNKFVDFIQEFPETVMVFLRKLFVEDIPYVVGYGVGWMIKTISDGLTKTVDFFKELPGKVLKFLLETISNVTTWSTEMRDKAIKTGTEFLANVIKFIKELPGKVTTFLVNVITNVTKWSSDMKSKATEAGSNFLKNVIKFIKELPGNIAKFLTESISKMIQFASDMKEKAKEAGKNTYDAIVDEISKIPGKLVELGADIINGLIKGVTNNIRNVASLANKVATSFINGFKKKMDIHSPSRVMFKLGQFVTEGLGLGIEDKKDKLIDAMGNVVSALMDGSLVNEVVSNLNELRKSAIRKLEELQSEWLSTVRKINQTTSDEFKSMNSIGKQAGQNLLDGLTSMEGAILGKARSIAQSVQSTMMSALGSTSVNTMTFDTQWNAKGGIFTQPTIFGASGGKLQGAGEAGPEAVLPLNDETLGAIGKGIAKSMGGANITINSRDDAESIARAVDRVYRQISFKLG